MAMIDKYKQVIHTDDVEAKYREERDRINKEKNKAANAANNKGGSKMSTMREQFEAAKYGSRVIVNPVSTKDYVKAIREDYNNRGREENNRARQAAKEVAAQEAFVESVINKTEQRNRIQARYTSFHEDVQNALLSDCLFRIYEGAVVDTALNSNHSRGIMRSMVNGFIRESGGAGQVINKMRSKSIIMSELAGLVNKYTKIISESVDKDNVDSFTIKAEIREKFFDDLDMEDTQSVSDSIKQRVTDSIDEFVQTNTNDQMDIKAALANAAEKAAANKDDEAVQESYAMLGKQKISDIRNRKKGVYHSMISSLAESAYKHDELKNEFFTEGHIDMDKIANRTTLMYTFMEMTNATGLVRVDEEYIADVIDGLSK